MFKTNINEINTIYTNMKYNELKKYDINLMSTLYQTMNILFKATSFYIQIMIVY